MNTTNSGRLSFSIAAAAALTLVTSAASAQDWQVGVSQADASLEILEQEPPKYPGAFVRNGQEGWVRLSYIVAPDGSATDPLVIDSSGGHAFEEEARRATAGWVFGALDLPAGRPNNIVNFHFEYERGRDRATSNFMRRYVRIVNHLRAKEYEEARSRVDSAHEVGGWNLYESTMLWLMTGRVEGAEGDLAGKLESYRRAHSVSNNIKLKQKDRVDLLEKIFVLEDDFGQKAEAMSTYAELMDILGDTPIDEQIEARSAELRAEIDGDEVMTAQATIYNPCDCDEGRPLWYYKPVRRTFSFANLSGNVRSFEARCDSQRVTGPVEAGKEWTLAPEWGSCRVFVFGDDGATFDFVENPDEMQGDAPTAVAEEDVLDRRNRG